MKLTKNVLKEMVKEVIKESKENSMILSEASFTRYQNKINEQHIPFLLISAYRAGGNNSSANKALKQDLKGMGYSFVQVVGGGQEEKIDPQTGQQVFKTDPETGEEIPEVDAVREMTVLVMPYGRAPGEPEGTKQEVQSLFDAGRSMAKKYDQFAFILGYPQIVSDDMTGTREKRMFIAAYEKDAPSFGDQHRIKDVWAGPWTKLDKAVEDDVYFTKIAGTRGKFVERKIEELKRMKVENRYHGAWRDSQINRWKSLLED